MEEDPQITLEQIELSINEASLPGHQEGDLHPPGDVYYEPANLMIAAIL
jgi:hypothetical protein